MREAPGPTHRRAIGRWSFCTPPSSRADSGAALAVQVVNVGLGPAVDLRIQAVQYGPPVSVEVESVPWPAVRSGDLESFALPVRWLVSTTVAPDPDALNRQGCRMTGSYRDRTGAGGFELITATATGALDLRPPESRG